MRVKFSKKVVERLEGELIIAQRLNNLRLYKMVRGLLLIEEEISMEDIGRILKVNVRTVYDWLSNFITRRFSWLLGHHYLGRGRKCKLTKEQNSTCMTLSKKGLKNMVLIVGFGTVP